MDSATRVIDRRTGKIFEEKIFGETFVRWAHESSLGVFLTSSAIVQKLTSVVYGAYASSPFSRGEIPRFLADHPISMEDFVEPDEGFKNFNEFFSRRLKRGARTFSTDSDVVSCPAEGRVFYSPIADGKTNLVIKGTSYAVSNLIGEKNIGDLAHAYVIRLCPVDYHRYHFGISGKVVDKKTLGAKLFSVNPMALNMRNNVFWENERVVFKLQTEQNKICYQIEVGAICVGTMTQTKDVGESFRSGDEKGTFLFGGSTVILLLPQGFQPEADLVHNSGKGFETLVRVGETIARI